VYTREPHSEAVFDKEGDCYGSTFQILDPEGDEVCVVVGDQASEDLLSHLNRGLY
jgi:hypothetical protein